MNTINLSDLEQSEVKYKISQFPDGQQDIVISSHFRSKSNAVVIKSRFNSFRDLELIIATNKALRRLGFNKIHLYIPYLLGARSDRLFQNGGNSYLVDIIAPIINAQKFKSVEVLDVHSDVAAACIKNLINRKNGRFVMESIAKIYEQDKFTWPRMLQRFIMVSPDAGAAKKVYDLAKAFNYTSDIVAASKHRDIEGKLTETKVPLLDEHYKKDMIIIDDICDGGRTFIEIAKIIKSNTEYKGKIYLIVTHGIFSNGYDELFKYFDGIYTTNSIKNIGGLDGNSNKKINVHQINVI